ncbi:fibronectin type III domain-containing protein [Candidatus Nitronereus thalassa]|uniref:Ig-like domain-containing protein n=1 Tax=Candidatus Nitronereus thalassa TaxID=3020898 RepID=A0ABU3K6G6_9BACT|nr:fibronectin type III domain-containing protein [Candidatus Nitronereus thalassa]MDT7041966.1 Ig-like domain-containing protein [Candidatus Nitronereus thalassa]
MSHRSVVCTFYAFIIFTLLTLFPFQVFGANDGEVSLTWNLNGESDIFSYNLYFGTQSGNYNAPGSPISITHPQNSTTVTRLQTGQEYFFALTAIDQAGLQSPPSDEISTVVPGSIADTTPPSTPVLQSAVANSSTQATLTWAAATDNVGVTGYTLYRDNNPITTTSNLTFVDTTLSPDTTYDYFVMAHDAANNSSGASAPMAVTTTSAGDSSPVVAWKAPDQNPGGAWINSGWDNRTFRILLDGDSITRSGSTIQLTLQGRSSGSYTLQRVSLVQRDGNTLNGVDTSSRQVTFGGSWNSGVTVPAGQTVTSDPIAFDLVAGQDVFLTFWAPAGQPTAYYTIYTTGTNTSAWVIQGADQSSAIDWESFNIPSGQTRPYIYTAATLEVLSSGGTPADTTPPSVTSITSAVADSATQATLTWAPATDNVGVTGYTLYRNNNPITTTANLSYVDAQLSPSTTYAYTVVAHDAEENTSASSAAASVTTPALPDTTPPSTPIMQSAVANSSTQATLTWSAATDNVGVTGYTLYRDNNPVTTTANLSYVDSQLSPSTTYAYTVVAHDAENNDSAPSTAASVTTAAPADTTPPSTPVLQSAVANSSTQATLTWAAATDNVGVTGYTLYRDNNPITTTSNLTFVDTTLSPDTTYDYFVMAHDAANNSSGASAPMAVTTTSAGDSSPVVAWKAPDQNPGGAWINSGWDNRTFRILLDGDSITRSGSTIQLTLQGRSSGSYTLQRVSLVQRDGNTLNGVDTSSRQVTFGGSWNSGVTVPAGQTVTSDPIAFDLVAGQDVFLTFWAPAGQPTAYYTIYTTGTNTSAWVIQGADQSSAIDWESFNIPSGQTRPYIYTAATLEVLSSGGTPADTTPPSVTSITSAVADSATQATLTWAPATDNVGVTGYTLYRNNNPITTTANLSYVDAQLSPSTTYAYTVVAHDAEENTSASSAAASVTTPALPDTTPPSTPIMQSAVANSSTQATLTWSAATDNVGVTGYTLYRDNNPVTTTANLSYVDSQLSPSTTYAYTVVAHDAENNDSAPSTAASVTTAAPADTTPPSTPVLQSAVANSSTQATLTWAAATDNVGVTGYTLYRDNNPITTTSNLTFVDTTLSPDTTYDYFVMAHDAANNSSGASAPMAVTTTSAGDSSPVVAWKAPDQNPGGAWINSGWDNRTFRILLDGDSITRSGSTIQLTLQGRSSGSYTLQRVSLVQRDGNTLNGVDTSSRQVTFGGSWNSGVTVPAGQTVTSDPIAFDLVAGQDVFLTFWAPAGQPTAYYTIYTTGTNTSAWVIQGADQSSAIDWESFNIPSGQTRPYIYTAATLEVLSSGGTPADTTPPSVTSITSAVADSATQATLTWAPATDNVGVTGYTLYRNNNPITTTANLSYVDAQLSPSTTYAYTVVAHDAEENTSASSAAASVTTPALPDTTPPTVSITAPTSGATVQGTVTVTATASDNVGVLGVQFQLDGQNLGNEDTTNTYSAAWDTSATSAGPHTLTAIVRDAAGNSTTSSPVIITIDNGGNSTNPGPLAITNLQAQSGKSYLIGQAPIANNQIVYIDRWYTFDVIPSVLTGATYIQTANDDNGSTTDTFLSFDVNQPVTVYVAHDDRMTTKPAWLNTYTETGQSLQLPYTTLHIYRRTFPAGTVTLGGNRIGPGEFTMYTVAVKPETAQVQDTTPPSVPSITSAVANSANQATLSWAAATDNVGVTGYTLYRDNNPITTTSNLSYVDSNLAPASTYAYTVSAQDAQNNVSAKSPSLSVTTHPDSPSEPPGAPIIQAVQPNSDSQMTITWTPAINEVLAGVEGSVNLGSQAYCPTLDPPNTSQPILSIASGDVSDLLSKVSSAQPGSTILLADGVYALQSNQSLSINTPGLTIRSASGNREGVKISGGYNNITVKVDDITIADVTLDQPTNHNIQVQGELGITGTKIYNVHMLDAGQQFVKISAGDGTNGKFADNGLVACSLIEYSTFSKGTSISPPSYTNGVDLLAGKGWVVRDNEFRRIRSEAGPAGPAILVWKNSIDTIIRRNLIVDSWRGIALGLSAPNYLSRGGAGVIYDHQNGLVENNVILALNEPADAAIENNYALNSQVRHNTVYYSPALSHSVSWSIEYRFEPTTVSLISNLTNLPILARSPQPTQEGMLQGNITDAQANWFIDIGTEQYHLAQNSQAAAAVTFTLYRDGIPVGSTTSWSYQDSYLSPSTLYNYTVTALSAGGEESSPSSPVSGTTLAPQDSTYPQVAITSPGAGEIVSGIVTVSATASDNISVLGVQFQLDGQNLGNEDTTNTYSAAWDTSATSAGPHTLTAIVRDAAGNSTTSSPVIITIDNGGNSTNPGPLAITNLQAQSGKSYLIGQAPIANNQIVYIDRWYTFDVIPSVLTGATYIQTANDDNGSTTDTFLSFDVNQPVTVYVAHDDRMTTKPAWLNTYTETGQSLQLPYTTLHIYRRTFPAGTVTLGGNRIGPGEFTMYTVAVKPDAAQVQDTTPPSVTSISSLVANSATQATLSWAAATDNVGVAGYNIYRNGILLSTTPALNYVDSGLNPSTTYDYSVQALDAAGNIAALSSPSSVTTPNQGSTGNGGTATLSWQKNTENDLMLYMVYYGTVSQVYDQSINVGLTTTPNTPSYTITGLAAGTYYFTVRAVDTAGNAGPAAAEAVKVIIN